MQRFRDCYPILTKVGMCEQILVKLPNIKFYDNLVRDFRVVTCGQTERLGEANRRFLQLFITNAPTSNQEK
jgi:hypothetical protein